MKAQTLVRKYLPQNQDIEVLVPNYKEPILPVNHGGFGWYGLMAYNEQGQLMCHECGVFRDSLSRHVHKHGLNHKEYRKRYGLLNNTRLSSIKSLERYRRSIMNRPIFLVQVKERFKNKNINNSRKWGGNGRERTEFKNHYDSCPAQLIRWLIDLAEKFGPEVSQTQVRTARPGLDTILAREFGSFNKAKQICKLTVNSFGHNKLIYSKQLILENMCCFYSKYGCWPKYRDYTNGKMICSANTSRRYGDLKTLRQEAMKLREQQEAARIRGEQVVQYANKIEFENAGYARR